MVHYRAAQFPTLRASIAAGPSRSGMLCRSMSGYRGASAGLLFGACEAAATFLPAAGSRSTSIGEVGAMLQGCLKNRTGIVLSTKTCGRSLWRFSNSSAMAAEASRSTTPMVGLAGGLDRDQLTRPFARAFSAVVRIPACRIRVVETRIDKTCLLAGTWASPARGQIRPVRC